MRILAVISVLPWVLLSCDTFSKRTDDAKDPLIARVSDHKLYASELANLDLQFVDKDDSIRMVAKYVDGWIRRKLLYAYAEENLQSAEPDISRQIEEYRESLIIYHYENLYVLENIDTAISTSELREQYNRNRQAYRLTQDVYAVQLFRVPEHADNIDSARSYWRLGGSYATSWLVEYASSFGAPHVIEDTAWMSALDLAAAVPPSVLDPATITGTTNKVTDNSGWLWFVRISDIRRTGSDAPLAFVASEVRNSILNKRKEELLSDLNTRIYRDAARRNLFESKLP